MTRQISELEQLEIEIDEKLRRDYKYMFDNKTEYGFEICLILKVQSLIIRKVRAKFKNFIIKKNEEIMRDISQAKMKSFQKEAGILPPICTGSKKPGCDCIWCKVHRHTTGEEINK